MDAENSSYCVKKLQNSDCSKGHFQLERMREKEILSDKRRIEMLEQEVITLREEIKRIKRRHDVAEDATLRAIRRGACALGGKFKVLLPESVKGSVMIDDNIGATKMHFCDKHAAKSVTPLQNDGKANKAPKLKTQSNCGNYTLG